MTANFNSRPCERGDSLLYMRKNKEGIVFQFTPLREGRRRFKSKPELKQDISIHAPARGATATGGPPALAANHNFNSRPCERGDTDRFKAYARNEFISIHAPARGATENWMTWVGEVAISIHAPARGATGNRGGNCATTEISIHAPARGATLHQHLRTGKQDHFNSRPCERGDRRLVDNIVDCVHISIHAPARGATRQRERKKQLESNFNSRPCERGDAHTSPRTPGRIQISIHAPARGATWQDRKSGWCFPFQFTPLREGRLTRESAEAALKGDFNSRPCERGDPGSPEDSGKAVQFISIHAPARGATIEDILGDGYDLISIHAPARGATAALCHIFGRYGFQFTPLREGRPPPMCPWTPVC